MRTTQRIIRRPSSKASNVAWPERMLCIAVVLAFILGNPGETLRVQAATPLADGSLDATLRINISGSGTLCAGQDYQVSVTPRLGGGEVLDTDGRKHKLVEIRPEAVAIEAFSTNTGVATISPRKALSGWDITGYDTSAAMFNLHATKAGSTRIYFEASIRGNYVGPGVDVKVANCRYKIILKGTSAGSGDNIFLTQVYTAKGEIAGDPSAALTGDSQVSSHWTQAGDCYAASKTSPPYTAHLSGTLSEDDGTLTVTVTFDALTVSTTVTLTGLCARAGAITKTAQGQLQPAPIVFKVPSTSNSDSQPITLQAGAVTLTGTATITVVPLASQ